MKNHFKQTSFNSLKDILIYLKNSFYKNGILLTLKKLFIASKTIPPYLHDLFFDILNNTETQKIVEIEDFDIPDKYKKHIACRCASTNLFGFNLLMKKLKLPKDYGFVDIGCGKGKVLLLAKKYGFEKIYGIEFSEKIYNIACSNVEKFENIQVTNMDATEYSFKPNQTIFYFFGLDNELMLNKVLDNISESLKSHPRPAWIIYLVPRLHQLILERSEFKMMGEYKFYQSHFIKRHDHYIIYSNNIVK